MVRGMPDSWNADTFFSVNLCNYLASGVSDPTRFERNDRLQNSVHCSRAGFRFRSHRNQQLSVRGGDILIQHSKLSGGE